MKKIKVTIEAELLVEDGEMHGTTRLQKVSHPKLGELEGFSASWAATQLIEQQLEGFTVTAIRGIA